jgi:hypothetical protein
LVRGLGGVIESMALEGPIGERIRIYRQWTVPDLVDTRS